MCAGYLQLAKEKRKSKCGTRYVRIQKRTCVLDDTQTRTMLGSQHSRSNSKNKSRRKWIWPCFQQLWAFCHELQNRSVFILPSGKGHRTSTSATHLADLCIYSPGGTSLCPIRPPRHQHKSDIDSSKLEPLFQHYFGGEEGFDKLNNHVPLWNNASPVVVLSSVLSTFG